MKNTPFGIILLSSFLLFGLSACQRNSNLFLSKWSATAPIVDGQLNEWQTPLDQPSAQVGIRYRCSNDAEYLYLAVHIPDEYTKALILNQGATIWIDTTGKRRDKIGIGYPIPTDQTTMEELAGEAKGDQQKFMELYAASFQEFDLIGIVEEPVRASNLTSKDLKVAAGFDNLKGFIFELKIPLKQIYGRTPALNEVLALGIQVNPMKKSMDDTDDGSLFNDQTSRNNGITQSNPLMGSTQAQMGQQNQQFSAPTRQPSMPNLWMKVKLSAAQ